MVEEYPLISQFEILGINGLLLVLLILVSMIMLLLAWLNYFRLKSQLITKVIAIALPIILSLSIWNIFLSSWLAEYEAESFVKRLNYENIPARIYLAGYYVAKLVPRYSAALSLIVCLTYIPLLDEYLCKKKK